MTHLLETASLSQADAIEILDTAELFAAQPSDGAHRTLLRGVTIANAFFEDSTRTRLSFEVAATNLGARVITMSATGSSLSKGESLVDTAATLHAMGTDVLVMRHSASGAAATVVQHAEQYGYEPLVVVNAGDGTHEHPTQALLDAFTLRSHYFGKDRPRSDDLSGGSSDFRDLTGLRVLIVGDIGHSRVAKSNLWLLRTLGAELHMAGPDQLMPAHSKHWPATFHQDFESALKSNPHVVMMLRVQRERLMDDGHIDPHWYAAHWQLDDRRMALLPNETVVMHPGPMNRGLEISSRVASGRQSLVLRQVAAGVPVRMAVLLHAMREKVSYEPREVRQ